MANVNSYDSTNYATISCADNNVERAKGSGAYNQKAYNPIIKIVCEYEHIVLRTVEVEKIQYEILWDGELLNRYSTLKIAETFFMDFAGIGKAKYKKLAHF